MCGITGFIDTKNTSSLAILKKMNDTMLHRGPDGGKEILLDVQQIQVGLGHRRLSIIDLTEGGTQPMQFENLCICFNGEIYNYKTIKDELIAKGHHFNSDSDTEVILHAYKEWGKSCVDKFRGMFAFIIVDTQTGDIFSIRDRVGIKPFYYYYKDGIFLFGSELKPILQHPNFKKEINIQAVEIFLQFGNIPAPFAIYNSTYKLKPGHFLSFNISELSSNDFKLKQHQYWNVYDAYNRKKLNISFEEAKSETEKILKESYELRMIADVPVGVFLSGGFDSAAVTTLLQKDRIQKLKTFTISVPDIGLNEGHFAKKVAQHLGTEHTAYECSAKEALKLFDDLPYYYDEPFGDSSAIPTSLVSKIAREQVTVSLSADGGDEIFAGYNRYDYLMKYGKKLNQIPSFARNTIAQMMNFVDAGSIPYFKNKYNFSNRYEKLKGLLKNPSPEQLMLSLSQQFDQKTIDKLLLHRTNFPQTAYNSKELGEENYSPLSYMMAIDYQTYLPDDILTKVDRATMRFSLEGREPFLDHKVIEWVAQLPDTFKYNNGIKKHILREIVYQYIPKTMMDRPKMGFAIPIEDWMCNELRPQLEYYLSEDKIKAQGILNSTEVTILKNKFLGGKKELSLKIWYLLMFQMWYEKWIIN